MGNWKAGYLLYRKFSDLYTLISKSGKKNQLCMWNKMYLLAVWGLWVTMCIFQTERSTMPHPAPSGQSDKSDVTWAPCGQDVDHHCLTNNQVQCLTRSKGSISMWWIKGWTNEWHSVLNGVPGSWRSRLRAGTPETNSAGSLARVEISIGSWGQRDWEQGFSPASSFSQGRFQGLGPANNPISHRSGAPGPRRFSLS